MNRNNYLVAFASGLCAFLFYLRTLAPTVYTFDSAEFATGSYVLGIIHPTGYPLYLLLGKLFTLLPIGDVAYRVNLMSAVWGGVTIALLALLCYRVTLRIWISAAAALVFAFSHYYWPEAVVAETYTLNTTLVTLLLLVLLRGTLTVRRAAAAGLILGLSFTNHMSTILIVPALAFWLMGERPKQNAILGFALFVLIGLSLYLFFPWRYGADPPLNYAKTYFAVDLRTPDGIWSWITGEPFRPFMGSYSLPEIASETARYLSWLVSNFVGAGLVLGVIGIAHMVQENRRTIFFFGLVFLSYTAFFINYSVINKDTMFSVSYLVWTVWIASGANALDRWLVQASVLPKWAGPDRVLSVSMMVFALVTLVVNYAWADQSQNQQARQFATQLLESVEPSSLVVTEWTWATPLEYLQIVEGLRPDVVIFDRGLDGLAIWDRLRKQGVPDSAVGDQIEQELAARLTYELKKRPVYVTQYDDVLARQFTFVPQDRFYRLQPKAPTGISPENVLSFRNGDEYR